MSHLRVALTVAAVVIFSCRNATAVPMELLTNGGFETGTFSGWTTSFDPPLGGGPAPPATPTLFLDTPRTTTPTNMFATMGNPMGGGIFYAVTDQSGGASASALLQSFTVPLAATSVVVSFDLFVASSAAFANAGTLSPAGAPGSNQHARVDILTAAVTPFSTAAMDIVTPLYGPMVDTVTFPPAAPWMTYAPGTNLIATLLPGMTYQIRMAQVNNGGS